MSVGRHIYVKTKILIFFWLSIDMSQEPSIKNAKCFRNLKIILVPMFLEYNNKCKYFQVERTLC